MIHVALTHKSTYRYDRAAELGPQTVRLRPAPHCRTPILSYSLSVEPSDHFLNWQQDPQSNYLARLVFPEPTRHFEVVVDLVAEMTVVNPFDFFLEPDASEFPFGYSRDVAKDLQPFLELGETGPLLASYVKSIDVTPRKTIDFLVALNQRLQSDVRYLIRMEAGVQSPEETLSLQSGSCRDSAWLLVQVLRRLGLAARFVSGYLIQLKPDVEPVDGPVGPDEDFTDLHAWTEVFLPGAGWVGLDPTSGLLAGEGHIPLACTPNPIAAAPISGTVGQCEVSFSHTMSVRRVREDARVTKPYSDAEWNCIDQVGRDVDVRLKESDVRLTMGGEPTFISLDDFQGEEWRTASVGPNKRRLAGDLLERLQDRFAAGGLLHYGQGKWYPGESLPRWTLTALWRSDGEPIWKDPALLADPARRDIQQRDPGEFAASLATRLGVDPEHAMPAYEDALYHIWKERRLPVNADLSQADTSDEEQRATLARALAQGLSTPIGYVLPLEHQWWNARARWVSGSWPVRSDQMFLLPGDSPMGLRLPLDSLPEGAGSGGMTPLVPFEGGGALPDYHRLRAPYSRPQRDRRAAPVLQHAGVGSGREEREEEKPPEVTRFDGVVRTALCVEPRHGALHIFMPPVPRLDSYLELVAAIEETADELETPVVVEGYLPPPDYRLNQLKVAPDPGVIEVNVHPAASWEELVDISEGLYNDARQVRLGTERFETDGTHTGTGGGNHVVMGGASPADSPFLRRPDLLRSLLGYWHNHPSLSYLFSGRFVGPTSQAPRVDEGRRDAVYELQIAFDQIPEAGNFPPWLVDRVFRHLLVDLTGNTHRAEFCIDKLYSPDSATGRLGLVEFRAFEMPPHWQMSLTQQLLLRALVARFWERPYRARLVDWQTSIHDQWMLPEFVFRDFCEVISETQEFGIPIDPDWFRPHFEFRFPLIGEMKSFGIDLELRAAIEPWYVLGEEPAGGATARYVDSSVERLQVKVSGILEERHAVICNGRRVPLRPTGVRGEFVAGVRYRAWQPPSCLHPTIGVDEPLVFDLVDTWHGRSMGGCKYHVGHPGGLNPGTFPVNANEAESRRAARFFAMGHSPGTISVPPVERNDAFPLTLDLRRKSYEV